MVKVYNSVGDTYRCVCAYSNTGIGTFTPLQPPALIAERFYYTTSGLKPSELYYKPSGPLLQCSDKLSGFFIRSAW